MVYRRRLYRRRPAYRRRPVVAAKRRYVAAKRRPRRTYSRFRRRTAFTINNNIGIASSRVVKLTYNMAVNLQNAIVTHAAHFFKANSIFDPDDTGVGHQPLGHDEWSLLYKKYLVLGCTIKAQFFREGTGGEPVACGLFLDQNASFDNELNTKLEQVRNAPSCVKTLLTNSREKVTLWRKYSPHTFFNKVDAIDDHQMAAPFGSNPILPAYVGVWTQTYDGTAATTAVKCNVTLYYTVKLMDPVMLTQS